MKPNTDRSADGRDTAGTRKVRKRKARRLTVRRLFLVVLIIALVVVAWQNWDTVAPDKVILRIRDALTDDGGSYPVDITGANVSRLVYAQSYCVTLSDTYLTYLSGRGGMANRYPCTYSSPLMSTAGNYVLLAEQGSKRVQLCTRTEARDEVTVSQNILAAAVNKKGQYAVLTEGPPGYAVQVTVYSKKGEVLYTRSRGQTAVGVALSPDGRQVALLSIRATNGTLQTVVETFSTRSAENGPICSTTAEDALLYRINFIGKKRLAAVGEDRAILLPTNGGEATVYTPAGAKILGSAVGSSGIAVATRPYGETGGGTVTVLDQNGKERCRVDFDGDFRSLTADGNRYLLLTDKRVQMLTEYGAGKQAETEADGQQAVLSGNDAVVLGLNTIQKYTLA